MMALKAVLPSFGMAGIVADDVVAWPTYNGPSQSVERVVCTGSPRGWVAAGAGSLQGLARCLPELSVREHRSNALIFEQVFFEQVLHMYRPRSV